MTDIKNKMQSLIIELENCPVNTLNLHEYMGRARIILPKDIKNYHAIMDTLDKFHIYNH